MTLKLYFAPGACSFVPHVLLEEAGAPFEPVLVKVHKGEQKEPPFLAINPRGQVPVLAVDEQPITQILAIVLYLDQRFPERRFLPVEALARTRALETLAWMNNTVHPTFTHVFMPFKFAATPEAQAELRAFNGKVYDGLLAELQDVLLRTQGKGLEWLSGDCFGPLDAYALTLLRWGGLGGLDPTRYGTLWSHVQKVAARPAVARAMERERLQLNLYKPA